MACLQLGTYMCCCWGACGPESGCFGRRQSLTPPLAAARPASHPPKALLTTRRRLEHQASGLRHRSVCCPASPPTRDLPPPGVDRLGWRPLLSSVMQVISDCYSELSCSSACRAAIAESSLVQPATAGCAAVPAPGNLQLPAGACICRSASSYCAVQTCSGMRHPPATAGPWIGTPKIFVPL